MFPSPSIVFLTLSGSLPSPPFLRRPLLRTSGSDLSPSNSSRYRLHTHSVCSIDLVFGVRLSGPLYVTGPSLLRSYRPGPVPVSSVFSLLDGTDRGCWNLSAQRKPVFAPEHNCFYDVSGPPPLRSSFPVRVDPFLHDSTPSPLGPA